MAPEENNHSIENIEHKEKSNEKLSVSINKYLINKESPEVLKSRIANEGFQSKNLTRQELAEEINKGYAYSAQFNGKRSKKNFIQSSIIALDFDGEMSLQEITNDDFINKHAAIIHTTPSHGKEGKDRVRVIFPLKEPIQSIEAFEKITRLLLQKYPKADQSCKDSSRFFFGSIGSIVKIGDGYFDDEALHHISPSLKEANVCIDTPESQLKTHSKNKISIEEAKRMLSYIDPRPGYDTWMKICFAIASEFGEAGKTIINEWSPDYKTNGAEVDKLFKKADGRITMGTVKFIATQNGYQRARTINEILINKGKGKPTYCQVIYQELFFEGEGFAYFGNTLHIYEGGYYKEMSDHEVTKIIANFFDTYITGFDEDNNPIYEYALPNLVEQSLKYVKMNCFVDSKKINPIGLNTKNGYLQLSYKIDSSNNRQPSFQLLPHSPKNYFTFIADFNYDPNANSEIFDQAINDMLSQEEAEALFKVLAASFDLDEIRRIRGREVKMLFLYGKGANGKDTIRVWVSLLVGGYGITNIGLKSFKKGDDGASYELFSLVHSRINWASENQRILIDQCQTLKSFATGDSLIVRQIYGKPTSITPKAISLFNLNDLPSIQTSDEAMDSRTGIIWFKNTFKSNPKKNNPNEKLANPLLKEDEQYIKKNILPAFLNRLIESFHSLYNEGIDYSFNDSIMTTIREDNNHFQQFINETGLIECSIEEGEIPKKLYLVYLIWCYINGILEFNHSNNKNWNDPSPYDKAIRDVRQFGIRLKKSFPGMLEHRGKDRIKGLKFNNGGLYLDNKRAYDAVRKGINFAF
jgi:phage/plasmid-associated DNA primase